MGLQCYNIEKTDVKTVPSVRTCMSFARVYMHVLSATMATTAVAAWAAAAAAAAAELRLAGSKSQRSTIEPDHMLSGKWCQRFALHME